MVQEEPKEVEIVEQVKEIILPEKKEEPLSFSEMLQQKEDDDEGIDPGNPLESPLS